jgi:hypothetical protein
LRWECPPEGAKSKQGYTIEIMQCISPTGFMGFHRNLKDLQKGEKGESSTVCQAENSRERGEEKLLTEGEEEGSPRSPEHGRRRWPPVEIAGEGKIARRRELGGWEKKQSLWLGSVGLEAVF